MPGPELPEAPARPALESPVPVEAGAPGEEPAPGVALVEVVPEAAENVGSMTTASPRRKAAMLENSPFKMAVEASTRKWSGRMAVSPVLTHRKLPEILTMVPEVPEGVGKVAAGIA